MEQKDPRQIRAALIKPFAPEDLEWRLQQTFEDRMRGIAVPYVTNRAIQNRLDEAVGPENWYNEYKPWHGAGKKEAQLCGITIHFEGRGFITKWDGAEDSDIEPVKGGLSDSMKRAAVQWGIGRVLYNMDTVYVEVERKGRSNVIKVSERGKLDQAYLDMLKKLGLTPAPPCGTQAQLTPEAPKESTPDSGSPDQEIPSEGRAAPPVRPSGEQMAATAEKTQSKVVDIPCQSQPAFEYMVESAVVQKGMSSQSTSVVLKDAMGNRVRAFARGAHEELKGGKLLVNVKLSVKQQGTVAFNYLEHYDIVDSEQHVA